MVVVNMDLCWEVRYIYISGYILPDHEKGLCYLTY